MTAPAMPIPPAPGEGEYVPGRNDDPFEAAARKGLAVVIPSPWELFVDLDTEEQRQKFNLCLPVLQASGIVTIQDPYSEAPSPSGRPFHVHIRVKATRPVTEFERLAFQAMLGSDPMREALGYRRLQIGCSPTTVFFELPSGQGSLPPE